jgi:superfamily I DNA and/or RNA helicase
MLRQSVSVALDGRGTVTHATPSPPEFWNQCVGIVTPHRAQRALVIRELEQLFPGEKNFIDDAVDTVERFQGGERHTIIVTFGVADTDVIKGEEAFLMQLERTNVAISRAMAKCIVVLPKTLAAYIPEDKKALATAFALKDYIEEFCNIRVNTTLFDATQTRWAQVRYHQ